MSPSTKTVPGDTQATGEGAFRPLPVSPSPDWRYPIDTVPWERSSLCRQRDRPHRDPVPAPHARYPGYHHSLPAPWRGREEAAERPGGGGVSSDTSRQGKGRSAPSPSAPPPRGRYPIDTVPLERSSLCRQREHPHRNPFPAPRTVSGLSSLTARPLEGAGGGRGAAGRWGCFQRHVETGEGAFRPLPVSPSPTGAISYRYSAIGEILSLPST